MLYREYVSEHVAYPLFDERIVSMDPVATLYERERAARETLPARLALYYDGGLLLPNTLNNERPYVIANFVETIDGIVSYNAPGQMGGGMISGDNEQDKMVMGILRAQADAVIFGASSLHADTGHVRIPAFIAPSFAADYTALRTLFQCQEQLPMSVIVTASGDVDLSEPTFHTPGLRALIATTERGATHLMRQSIPATTEVRVVAVEAEQDAKPRIAPRALLTLLTRDYGVRVALYEGGPTLLASFLAEHLIDELFLTVAPHLAGQSNSMARLSLVAGHAFAPQEAPWATLLSVKLAGSHLLLRYHL